MKEIIHLALRTGFSFKSVYGHPDEILSYGLENKVIGTADSGNTFMHPIAEKKCAEIGIKFIYAVRLTVVENASEKVKPRGQFGCEYIFIAKNNIGLSEIYSLVKKYYDNFYYRGNISLKDVYKLTENVIVVAENFKEEKRIDYIALTTTTPKIIRNINSIPKVAIINNHYPKPTHHEVYDIFTRPRGNSNQTYQQHILSTFEWSEIYPGEQDAIDNTHEISSQCEIVLQKAPMIKYTGKETVRFLCKIGAKKKKIDIENGVYADRLKTELELIEGRNFQDYFLVVANMISKAKKKMLVGPSRGSSAGSLVCYLMGITEIDPIVYGLLFERFIDINRHDLPDIDIDFPDDKRDSVIKELVRVYGQDSVAHIANISTMQPKGAIGEFAKALQIPPYETEALKNAIIERSGGDSRAAFCMMDTFETTEIGKEFVKKFPSMKAVSLIEGHPRHSSVHAAGIIVCNEPIAKYAGVSSRDNTVMVDKVEAEYLNLLKIDVLGLRTLTILGECAKMVGMDHMDFYSLPVEDKRSFEIFNEMRTNGIFQFEGYSLMSLTRKMGVREFNDIVAITALARPGALYSGGAARYVKYRSGEEEPQYKGVLHEKVTGPTFGVVIYQEQILNICREIGNMSWTDVNKLRKALSKSLGEEFFGRYKEKFMIGAKENGYSEEDSKFIWNEVCYGGNYAFNKSHAVAYALISFWCAYMKARYPKEFTVANLNNAKDDDSALKILRDAVKHDGVEYITIDPDESLKNWSVNSNGLVVGGLLNIHGVGPAAANKIIEARASGEKLSAGIISKMINAVTPFDILYPADHYWGDIYKRPEAYGLSSSPSKIIEAQGKGKYLLIGKLTSKNIRDLNEYVNLQKRGGKVLEENTLELAIKIEDDTDNIMCSIGRFKYEDQGRWIAENGVVDQDWFLIKGEIKHQSRYLVISEIMKLDESMVGGD